MNRTDILYIIFIFCFSFLILLPYINKPYWGHHDWNNNIWSVTAKNNLTYGIACTKLGQSTSNTPLSDCSSLRYYQDHPPLVSWLLTLAYGVFGFSELVGRLPFALISAGSAVFLYLLGRILYNRFVGITAGLFFAVTPMFQYFGKMINHEPLVLFGVLWAVYSYVLWIKNGNRKAYWWYLGSAVFTGLSGWHGYFIFAFLAGLTFFLKRENIIKSLIPGLILTSIFGLHLTHTRILTGTWNIGMVDAFIYRISLSTITGETSLILSYQKWALKLFTWVRAYYTNVLVLGTGIYVGMMIYNLIRKKVFNPEHIFVVVLGINAAFVLTLFSQQSFIHDYLLIYLLPFIALSSAIAVFNLSHKMPLILKIAVLIALVADVYADRFQFTQSLLKTEVVRSSVETAHFMQQHAENNRYLLEPVSFYEVSYPALWNYAYGINVQSGNDTLDSYLKNKQSLEEEYDYIVTEETDPPAADLVQYLDATYQKEKISKVSIYKL